MTIHFPKRRSTQSRMAGGRFLFGLADASAPEPTGPAALASPRRQLGTPRPAYRSREARRGPARPPWPSPPPGRCWARWHGPHLRSRPTRPFTRRPKRRPPRSGRSTAARSGESRRRMAGYRARGQSPNSFHQPMEVPVRRIPSVRRDIQHSSTADPAPIGTARKARPRASIAVQAGDRRRRSRRPCASSLARRNVAPAPVRRHQHGGRTTGCRRRATSTSVVTVGSSVSHRRYPRCVDSTDSMGGPNRSGASGLPARRLSRRASPSTMLLPPPSEPGTPPGSTQSNAGGV